MQSHQVISQGNREANSYSENVWIFRPKGVSVFFAGKVIFLPSDEAHSGLEAFKYHACQKSASWYLSPQFCTPVKYAI